MHNLSKIKEQWVPLQNKVFSRWVSTQLQKNNDDEIINVTKDLSDGIALIKLAQILTHKKIEQKWYERPRSNIEKTQNCDTAIDLFTKDGVKFVGISGKDISDNNEKLILGLIWSLISYYAIGGSKQQNSKSQSKSNDKYNNKIINNKNNAYLKKTQNSFLLDWAEERISHYSSVHDFKPYDLAICALLDSYFPDKIKFNQLKPENHFENLDHAISIMNQLKIPALIYPEDLKKGDNEIDEKTLLTQLALIKDSIDSLNNKKFTETTPKINISNEEKESESSSDSFECSVSDNQSQKIIKEVELEPKSNDYELADDEETSVESVKQLISQNQMKINIGLNSNESTNQNDNKIRIKIKRGHSRGPSKKVKVLIKNSQGQVVEKTYKAKVSKLHIIVNQNKKQNEAQVLDRNLNINESNNENQEKEEEIRKQKEEEEIQKQRKEEEIQRQKEEEEINQIENEKELEAEELNRLKRDECEEEKSLESEEVKNSILNESEEEKSKELKKVKKAKREESEENSDSELSQVSESKIEEDADEADDEIAEVKNAKKESFDQQQYSGKKFGLVITLKGSDYNNGEKVEENQNKDGSEVRLALTLKNSEEPFLNSAGLKLDLAEENIKNNINQQFVFGLDDYYTVIDSEYKHGMVWDVANADDTNPPSGTPFYLYPFHGRHNQRFIYKNGMIYALQNNQVVTYVGGEVPLVMMPASEDLKSRQIFHVKLL